MTVNSRDKKKLAVTTLTPGQVRFFFHVCDNVLRDFDIHFFTRNFTESVKLIEKYARKFGFPYVVLGDYPTPNNSNDILKLKLTASIDRMQQLNDFMDFHFKPDVVLTFSSPDMVRVAYGRGIPIINVNDSPHNIPVVKLTFPLSTKTLVPQCVLDDSTNQHLRYLTSPENLLSWNGLKELSWIHDFNNPTKEELEPIKTLLESSKSRNVDTYFIVRLEESYSAYILDLENIRYRVKRLLKHLIGYSDTIVIVIARYQFHRELLSSVIKELGTDSIIVSPAYQFIDSMVLFSYLIQQKKRIISCFVGSGGTMNTESALLGLPTLSYYPNDQISVEKYLQKHGLVKPLRDETFSTDIGYIDKVVGDWDEMVSESYKQAQILVGGLESPCRLVETSLMDVIKG